MVFCFYTFDFSECYTRPQEGNNRYITMRFTVHILQVVRKFYGIIVIKKRSDFLSTVQDLLEFIYYIIICLDIETTNIEFRSVLL